MDSPVEVLANNLTEVAAESGIPEITEVSYDIWVLRVKVMFEKKEQPVYVGFEGVQGIRVLDEGDLREFWSNGACTDGWLFEIRNGGWFDLERTREGFVSNPEIGLREYLVAGINDCVSVLSYEAPTVYQPKP
ncbi:MAG: hypothetical protein H6953_02805 [Chromatiaceae bacterium]|nr:hypothetical protein [Chromatiaceae bacterium]MCP5314081.1 hypothetical protein [Chromatiaceae bacterium]